MSSLNNVILGLDPRIRSTTPAEILRFAQNDRAGILDSRPRIKYGASFAGMT
ncbi:MAG TPA: hypothetical protein VMW86_06300 [Dehalococcoidales bacterium]|nr:hypothetical protein [Dehalococcoidales bacterium]